MVQVDITKRLNPYYQDFFQDTSRKILLYGGAGAGKSYAIADKILIQSAIPYNKRIKVMVARNVFHSAKMTCLPILEERAEALKIPFQFKYGRSEAIVNDGVMQIIFVGTHTKEDYQKIKSLTDIDMVWINELNELRQTDYQHIALRMRGGHGLYAGRPGHRYKQLMMDMNPVGKYSWVYQRFFGEKMTEKIRSMKFTVDHNPYIEREYIQELDKTKDANFNFWLVYRKGEWGELEGVIFANYQIVDKPPEGWTRVTYGIDFGYTHPAAIIKAYRYPKAVCYQQLFYRRKKTVVDMIKTVKNKNLFTPTDKVYADSSRPDCIKQFRNAGFRVKAVKKGADSVISGLDWMSTQDMLITADSPDLLKELSSYVRKTDHEGNYLENPIDTKNDAIDAARYAIHKYVTGQRSFKITHI